MQAIRPTMDYIELRLPQPLDSEPTITMFGVNQDGVMTLIDAIEVGPFPDWERIARRVMRRVVEVSRRSIG